MTDYHFDASVKVKPLDLSTLIRDAFLSGRGLKDGDKLSEADQEAWVNYDPTKMNAYKRIVTKLYGRAFLQENPNEVL